MSFYLSQVGLITRFGEDEVMRGADHDNEDDPEVGTVDAAIRDAEAEINSYLGAQYDLPLPGVVDMVNPDTNTSVPDNLRRITGDIAMYRLATDYGRTLTREKRKRYDDALAWLQMIAKGDATLGLENPTPGVSGGPVIVSNPRLFTRDSTDGLI